MKIVFTKHALEKFKELEEEGWTITENKVKQIIKSPKWQGITKDGEQTALGLVDDQHILRAVLDKKDDIIKVITFHIGRRGRYESTL